MKNSVPCNGLGLIILCQFPTGPSSPPKSVRAVTRTMYSIGVKWDEVPITLRNGVIMSYIIRYHSDTSSEPQQTNVAIPSTRFANLSHLTKNTNYTITVLASNGKGTGPASDPIIVATSDGSKYLFCFIINYSMFENTCIFIYSFIRNDHLKKDTLVVQVKLIFVMML